MTELLEPYRQRWASFGAGRSSHLLKLVILRDLVRILHTERSRMLAEGGRAAPRFLKPLEERIAELRHASQLSGSLDEWLELNPKKAFEPVESEIPTELFESIPRDRLERYDRAWELAIAMEAMRIGWSFWALDAWINPVAAQEFHSALNSRLVPEAAVLFAEAAPISKSSPSASVSGWRGRWLIVVQSQISDPAADFELDSLPGILFSPQEPIWKRLFPE